MLLQLLKPKLLRGLGLPHRDVEFDDLLAVIELECDDAVLRRSLADAERFLELSSAGQISVSVGWAVAMTKLRQKLLPLLPSPVDESWFVLRPVIEAHFKPDAAHIQLPPHAEHTFLTTLVGGDQGKTPPPLLSSSASPFLATHSPPPSSPLLPYFVLCFSSLSPPRRPFSSPSSPPTCALGEIYPPPSPRQDCARCGSQVLLTTHYSLLTTHYSLPTTYYPLPTTHYPLLTSHYLLLTTHYQLLTTDYLQLTTGY